MPTSVDVKNLKINKLTEAQYDTAVQGGVIGENELSVLTDVELEQIQVSALPTASADELGKIYQYIGATDSTYTNAYFYKCVSDGQSPATYSWAQVNVMPAGSSLPSQTGNAGKFLTTDGTDASWATINALTNNSSASYSLAVGTNSSAPSTYCTCVGYGATSGNGVVESVAVGTSSQSFSQGVAIGSGSQSETQSVAIGKSARTSIGGGISSSDFAIAIGFRALADGKGTIQLGKGTNNTANTFKVANTNGNFEIMSADGTIPTARLTKVNSTITLTAAGWSSNTQTVTVNGVTSTSVVLVAPDPSDTADYVAAGILCTSQTTNSLTFTATTTPTNDIDVNIVCL